jgi:mannose-6-phosphate isomerase-like protein (cupin superfamily)
MEINVINPREKASLITELHAYKQIALMNDYEFKIVKVQRSFVWHKHPDTDEVFMAVEGGFEIQLRDKTLFLSEGDMVVIPKNVEHRPVCKKIVHHHAHRTQGNGKHRGCRRRPHRYTGGGHIRITPRKDRGV